MIGPRAFSSLDYLALEAERLGGVPERLFWSGRPFDVIKRTVPGTASHMDITSVYGYPDFPSVAEASVHQRSGFEVLRQQATARGIVAGYVRMGLREPIPNLPDGGMAVCVSVGDVVSVDLRRSSDAIFADYRKQLRNELRKPTSLEIALDGDIAAFHRMYVETMQRVGASQDYFFTLEYLTALHRLDGVSLVIARSEGRPVCGAIIITQGSTLFYHLGATADAALHESPIKRLLHDIIINHANGAYEELVLGGGFGAGESNLLRFKRGFSKRVHTARALRFVFQSDVYRRLSHINGALDLSNGFFPAYRAPRS